MLLCFKLSMPNVGSWNGKWTGVDNLYAIVRFMKTKKGMEKAQEILEKGYYYYNFGDGWAASISIKEIDGKESRRIKKASRGFCGYEWMIDSIIKNGKILNDSGEDHG